MYQAKDAGVRGRQLKVQRLSIPFKITGNATAANVVVAVDDPSILFVNTQGVTGISVANGAQVTGEVAPSFTSANDASGISNLLVRINEPLSKVVSAVVYSRALASGIAKPCNILAFATGTNAAQSIYLDCTHGVNLSSSNLDGVLIVEYIIDPTQG